MPVGLTFSPRLKGSLLFKNIYRKFWAAQAPWYGRRARPPVYGLGTASLNIASACEWVLRNLLFLSLTSFEIGNVLMRIVRDPKSQLWWLQVTSKEDPEFWSQKRSNEGVVKVVKSRQLGGIVIHLLRRQTGVCGNERLE